jgi:hypothetical protein
VTELGAVRITAESPAEATRAPSDVLRLAVGLVVLLAVVLVGLLAGDSAVELVADHLSGLRRLPSWFVDVLAVVAHLAVA